MKNNTLRKLYSYVAEYKGLMAALIIAALLANAFALAAPFVSGRAIDFIKGENTVDFAMVSKFCAILLAV